MTLLLCRQHVNPHTHTHTKRNLNNRFECKIPYAIEYDVNRNVDPPSTVQIIYNDSISILLAVGRFFLKVHFREGEND